MQNRYMGLMLKKKIIGFRMNLNFCLLSMNGSGKNSVLNDLIGVYA